MELEAVTGVAVQPFSVFRRQLLPLQGLSDARNPHKVRHSVKERRGVRLGLPLPKRASQSDVGEGASQSDAREPANQMLLPPFLSTTATGFKKNTEVAYILAPKTITRHNIYYTGLLYGSGQKQAYLATWKPKTGTVWIQVKNA